ncbi:hypothetical protein V6N11_047344 [Hibiscus sabdariffa]|uniref:Uncharacterized protein n=1 Tax=Hibiscus sabdariffa TaxID=183260 RepID=A0ABR2PBQ7_9ROSI
MCACVFLDVLLEHHVVTETNETCADVCRLVELERAKLVCSFRLRWGLTFTLNTSGARFLLRGKYSGTRPFSFNAQRCESCLTEAQRYLPFLRRRGELRWTIKMVTTRSRGQVDPPINVMPGAGTSAQGARSIDPSRFEELESAVAALRAVLSNNRLREIETAQRELAQSVKVLNGETRDAVREIKFEIDELKAQMNLIQVAVGNSVSLDGGQKTRVPEPQRNEGNRDAKELENFLFDIE